jgi:uncharacterized protein (TIGR03790 family)
MTAKLGFFLFVVIFLTAFSQVFANPLEPNQILIIANADIKESLDLAKYYCKKRSVPKQNIFSLSLGEQLADEISRKDYQIKLAEPVRKKLLEPDFFNIRCLLTTYGVPFRVGARGKLAGQDENLNRLKNQLQLEENKPVLQFAIDPNITKNIAALKSRIDAIEGRETDASVDSELSMALSGDYELYRWQPNELISPQLRNNSRILMVSRLDGPTYEIVKGLIDKALAAEQNGLKGFAYIDSGYSGIDKSPLVVQYDLSLARLAEQIKTRTSLTVVQENTTKLFEVGQCPSTAIYCGWYSLQNYIDSFDFVNGAIGIHIASLEAVNLRDIKSAQWCPSMLRKGVTVTIGAVAEPYLHAFPEPDAFFDKLFDGFCVVEAYYYTNPFNSWRLLLIADPLYRPFRSSSR